jgi:CDP-glycerol glycerophosphotransferase (TagB/SpsB family)
MCPGDVMVTDYSSLAEEFLMFDRPLVIFDHLARATGRDAERRRRLDIEAVFPAADVTTDVVTIAHQVDRALSHPEEKAGERQRLRDYIFHQLDGQASQRAVAAIRELAAQYSSEAGRGTAQRGPHARRSA